MAKPHRGRRGKQKSTPKTNPSPLPPVNATSHVAPQNQSSEPKWTTGDYVGLFGGIVGVLGAIAGFLAWSEARESRKIAAEAQVLGQKSYDRAAGKVGARFAVVGFSPPGDNLPGPIKFRVEGQDEVRLPTLAHLRMMDPRLLIRNTGEEPIDAVRLETRITFVGVEFGGRVVEKQFGAMASWRHGHVEVEDVSLGRKLLPNETARIPLIRSLLAQLGRLRDTDAADKNNYGRFEIRCYARIVGAPAFDAAEADARSAIRFVWVPNGFPEDEWKRHLEIERPAIEITPGR